MPVKKLVHQSTHEVPVQTAIDSGGSELVVGDYVTIRLRVTNIRPKFSIESGQEIGQDLELGRVLEVNKNSEDSNLHKEYIHHYLVDDSKLFTKSY